jgi:hypothetical protein
MASTSSVTCTGAQHSCGSWLDRLKYTVDPAAKAYRNPQRRAVFIGDLVDRGPEQHEVPQRVKAMVDCDAADIVMGNHKFNAIEYATVDLRSAGTFLRPHSDNNTAQHQAFLDQVTGEQRDYPVLPDIDVGVGQRSLVYADEMPVFYGHYWRDGSPEHLLDWTAHTAGVDFSAVRGGTLVAYRWLGEGEIRTEHYVPGSGDMVAQHVSHRHELRGRVR